jgi:kinesin family member 11
LVDADQLLVELKNGLSQQELNFTEFVEQQHEVCKLHYANFFIN